MALESIKRELEVCFIDSNRLYASDTDIQLGSFDYNVARRNRFAHYGNTFSDDEDQEYSLESESIIRDAKDIMNKIQSIRQKYSLESEKLDRNFPDRLIEFVDSDEEAYSNEEIARYIEELETKRVELEKAGLVLSGKKSLAPKANIDDTMRKFYTLYIKDTFNKLELYDDIKERLELFMDIINSKTAFSNKKMKIDDKLGIVFEPQRTKSGKKHYIPLEKLSSGEKHDFIMFYELIFNSGENRVFLIDEPEISLHVAWQMEFIGILERICKLNGNMQAIIATHSPDIVNGRADLLISIDLEG